MNKFSDTLEEQKKNIKKEQDAKLGELLGNLDKFYSKFTASIPPDNFMPDKNTDIGAMAKEVKDVYNNWESLDKNFTDIIEEMLRTDSYVSLFPRPRRFGKSLFLSMVDNFFNIEYKDTNKDLFKGLKISKSEYYNRL